MEREFDISCGVDVGKWSHHFTAIDRRTGEILLDEKVGQDEGEIRGALSRILESGRTMVVVDQPGSMSALLFAVADGQDQAAQPAAAQGSEAGPDGDGAAGSAAERRASQAPEEGDRT